MSIIVPNFCTRARVPATSANLGPGFDALGLALQCYSFVSVQQSPSGEDVICASGEVRFFIMRIAAQDNIALIAARALLKTLNAPPCFLKITLENNIPLARGLGSSSAALIGALMATNEWARQTLGLIADGGKYAGACHKNGRPSRQRCARAAGRLGGFDDVR